MGLFCRHYRRLMSESMDGRPGESDRQSLDLHLRKCPGCRSDFKTLTLIHGKLAPPSPAPLPLGYLDMLLHRVRSLSASAPTVNRRKERITLTAMGMAYGLAIAGILLLACHLTGVIAILPPPDNHPAPAVARIADMTVALLQHAILTDTFFREIGNLNGDRADKDLQMIECELASSDIEERTAKLKNLFRYQSASDPANRVLAYLDTIDLTVREIRETLSGNLQHQAKRDHILRLVRTGPIPEQTASALLSSINTLDEQSKASPSDIQIFQTGRTLYYMGLHKQALPYFYTIARFHPQSPYHDDATYWYGRCAEQMGDNDRAQKAYATVGNTGWNDKRVW